MPAEDDVSRILASLPCSVELPAGTGKTQLIGRLVERRVKDGGRALVLTHTHAGVDVIRRRLKQFGVPARGVTVRTIDSWSFDLISKMPQLSGLLVEDEPDWSLAQRLSRRPHEPAVKSSAIMRMLRASYNLVVRRRVSGLSIVAARTNRGDRDNSGSDARPWRPHAGLFFWGAAPSRRLGQRSSGGFPAIEVSSSPGVAVGWSATRPWRMAPPCATALLKATA